MPLKLSILASAVVSFCSWLPANIGFAQGGERTTDKSLTALPDSLHELREQTEYTSWEPVRVFSRTLKHYRQLRFNGDWNVIVSETGKSEGSVNVVEVIRLPEYSEASGVSFAIYDPKQVIKSLSVGCCHCMPSSTLEALAKLPP